MDSSPGVEDPYPQGAILGNRYRVEGLIGLGAYGEVYRARQTDLDRVVALKLLRHDDADARLRFFREARIMANLQHPNIAQVLDLGTHEGRPFFVLELLRGQSVAARIAREGKLSTADVVRIGKGVCAALEAAHAKGIVHRDVKPSNVFLATREDGGEDVKLLDFGIAKRLATPEGNPSSVGGGAGRVTLTGVAPRLTLRTQAGLMVGSPCYLSPEQIFGETLDGRADIYALGITLYEALSGEAPFVAPEQTQLCEQILSAPVPPLRERVPDVPAGLERAIERALAKQPEDRYASASDFARALDAALQGTALQSAIETERPAPATRRALGIAALFSFLLAFGLLFLFVPRHRGASVAAPTAPTSSAVVPTTPPSTEAPSPPTAEATADANVVATATPKPRVADRPAPRPAVTTSPAPSGTGFRIDDLKVPFR